MGVRLYPMFKKEGGYFENVAEFLGYRPVDAALARQFEKVAIILDRRMGQEAQEVSYGFWLWFRKNCPRAYAVHDFALMGWGKFDYPIAECVGETMDRGKMRDMFLSSYSCMCITSRQWAMLKGVSWG